MLQRFLSNCPLLDEVLLGECEENFDFEQGNKFTFIELSQCVPSIKPLDVLKYYMKYLSAGGMPHKLPTSLVHLKYLHLEVCFMEHNEISSALCMIRSAPVLEKIVFLMYDNKKSPL
ncbi:hypothetical protein L1987_38892 [Smallanthus sonchifolius]|uniref:Uncharacterized protein n=1 Tax=Smallanthus sonchifolius TaxID=185202 RepID=A0ACB9HLT6_9ASTR|nr:hypothetical protein L1987_38892 [Smallanthus sonchifolius]